MGIVFQALDNREQMATITLDFVRQSEIENLVVGFEDGSLIDGNGWLPPVDYDASQRPWFIVTQDLEYGKIATTELYDSAATGSPNISLSKRITVLDGTTAVVAIQVPTRFIADLIKGYSVNQDNYLILLDSNGTVISHSNAYRYMAPLSSVPRGIKYDNANYLDFSNSGNLQKVLCDDRLENSYLLYSPLNSLEWTLLSVLPMEPIEQNVAYYTTLIIGIITFLMLILYISMTIFTSKITKGLEEKRVLEERFRAIFDSSPIACIISDNNLNFMEMNKRGQELFEISEASPTLGSVLDYSPKYQPDGSLSHEKVVEKLASKR
jgi:PAS domain-containing protein